MLDSVKRPENHTAPTVKKLFEQNNDRTTMAKSTLKNLFPSLYKTWISYQWRTFPGRVRRVLSDPRPPVLLSEADFDRLQNAYSPWWDYYGFEEIECWIRGHQRAIDFLGMFGWLKDSSKRILDVGCGDGMTALALSHCGHEVSCVDVKDWRLKQAKSLRMEEADISSQSDLPENHFDLIYSFNAFEHVGDPQAALTNMVKSCKLGGTIFVSFDPLFYAPLGLHAFKFHMPYPQLAFSDAVIQKKLEYLGNIDLDFDAAKLQPLNKWRPHEFEELFKSVGCEVLLHHENPELRHLDFILKHPQSFRGRNLTFRDISVSGIKIILRKKIA
jgi:2-polyprenyl-3-methyl-5-hydroxy-6-metoxy-1,4-benzoquinol methylase